MDLTSSQPQVIRNIEGAIFDCDGILVDSEQPWLTLMSNYLNRLDADDDAAENFRGLTAVEAVATLAHIAATDDSLAQVPTPHEVDCAYSAALASLVAPMPWAPAFVASMSGTIPIAVASNGRRGDVHGLLERAGMLDFFDAVVTIDDVSEGKPRPEPYLLAAERLGIAAASTVAFEDSVVGAQSADAAGCTVFGINEDPAVPLVAEFRLASFEQLRFDATDRSLHISAADPMTTSDTFAY